MPRGLSGVQRSLHTIALGNAVHRWYLLESLLCNLKKKKLRPGKLSRHLKPVEYGPT